MAATQYLMLSERARIPVPALWLSPPQTGRDSTAMIQAALNDAAGKREVVLKPGQSGTAFYSIAGRLTAPANTTLILDGAELRWASTAATGTSFLGSASRPGLEVTGSNFRLLGWGTWTGPSSAAYVANEIGVFAKGTNTGTRKSRFTIDGEIEFKNWGYAGWTTQFVDDVRASGFIAHDCGYGGWFALSCTGLRVHHFEVRDITPGTGGNAYGFSLTHDSTGYSTDPNIATPKLVANPFCIDFDVHDFTVENVVVWQGVDAHGGWDGKIHDFEVYNCRHGVSVGGSSGDAAAYGGGNLRVFNFRATTAKRDGSATGVTATDRTGLNISGGSTTKCLRPRVFNFELEGFGDTVVSSRSIQATFVNDGRIAHGTIRDWKGQGILVGNAGSSGSIVDVTLGAVASATNSECVRNEYATSASTWDLIAVKHRAEGGTVAAEGYRVTPSNGSGLILGCDFTEATTPLAGIAATARTTNSDVLTGSATFDPSSLADGAGETTTVTVTGAALGDFAEASFSLDLQGITLTAWVSAANTVSVRFQNETGGVLDLASGTLRARVRKAA